MVESYVERVSGDGSLAHDFKEEHDIVLGEGDGDWFKKESE